MDILDTLRRINEWWETKEIPAELSPPVKRRLFSELAGQLDDRRIVLVTGPRRSGKTTLMFQLMDHLIREKGVDARDILFFSGDDPDLRSAQIGDVIAAHREDFLRRDMRDGMTYVMIDEIHRMAGWELHLKKLHDMKYPMKFIVSGSSAAKIRSGQRDSLVGRISEYILYPCTFGEFLVFRKMEPIQATILERLNAQTLADIRAGAGPKRVLELKRALDEYLLVGGFPEWHETKSVRQWQKKLVEDVIKRVVYDDIASHYNVRNAYVVESLLRLVSGVSSQPYSFNSMAGALGIDNETAQKYAGYLRESFIIMEMKNYAASVEKHLKKNYKYVLVDTGLKNALDRTLSVEADNPGHVVEGAVQQHLLWSAFQGGDTTVFYWFDREEVDAVVKTPQGPIPIEVKYRKTVGLEDVSGLRDFMERYGAKRGIVVTRDTFHTHSQDGKEILFVPLWMFLSTF